MGSHCGGYEERALGMCWVGLFHSAFCQASALRRCEAGGRELWLGLAWLAAVTEECELGEMCMVAIKSDMGQAWGASSARCYCLRERDSNLTLM